MKSIREQTLYDAIVNIQIRKLIEEQIFCCLYKQIVEKIFCQVSNNIYNETFF